MARDCNERCVSLAGDRCSSSFSNAKDWALASKRTGLPAGSLPLMPDAVGQWLNALPQAGSDGNCFRTVLREQIVEKNDLGGHLPDLAGFLVERAFRGRDPTDPEYKCGQCTDQAGCHFDNVLRVRLQMSFRQKGSENDPQHHAPPNTIANASSEINKAFIVETSPSCRDRLAPRSIFLAMWHVRRRVSIPCGEQQRPAAAQPQQRGGPWGLQRLPRRAHQRSPHDRRRARRQPRLPPSCSRQ